MAVKLAAPVIPALPTTGPLRPKYAVGTTYKRMKSPGGNGARKSSQNKGLRYMTMKAAARRGRSL